MKRLLYSHRSDIDGMGSVILSKIAFDEIDYTLCKNIADLSDTLKEDYEAGKLYEYDTIYITDLSPRKELLEQILNDGKLKGKVYLFDHHETAYNSGYNDLENVTVIVQNEEGKKCATQIYYEFLLDVGFLNNTKAAEQFVELVRREDIYEWKKYNDMKAHDLAILFNEIGIEKYIETMTKKLAEKPDCDFEFSEEEQEAISHKKKVTLANVQNFVSKLKVIDVDGFKVGVCFIIYEYRNEVAEYLMEKNEFDLDCVAMFAFENNQISLRSIKDNSSARIVAEKYGGGGHDKAAAIPITDEMRSKIIGSVFNN